MPPLRPIPFATQSYQDPSRPINVQRLVNMYLQPKAAQSKTRTALRATPGLRLVGMYGDGPLRGIIAMGSNLYLVSGGGMYRVGADYVGQRLGSVAGAGPVSMATNGVHVVVATNSTSTYYATESGFGTLSVENVAGFTHQDGYILGVYRDSQVLFISGVLTIDFDPTDNTLVNANPDNNVGIANLNRETWVFNERSIQVYYNSGAADFPFTRNPAGVIEVGCASGASIVSDKGFVAWLGDDYRVYVNNGYQAQAISNTSIETAIQGLRGKDAAIGSTYSQNGHIHYILTFPGEATYVFDGLTGLWHERQSYERDDWRARFAETWGGAHYVGDAANGNLYVLDESVYDENGATLRRVMTSPPIHAGKSRLFYGALEIDLETGVGLEGSGQGADPQVMLRWTDDGGRTYSNELWRSIGKSGDYRRRVRWTGLGSSRDRSFELSLSDAVETVVIEAYASIQQGSPA